MAFEDFSKSVPVIAETNYDDIKILEGEGAHTDNFNRSVVDSINRDHALESALTYLARSSSLFVTANSRFLSHCEGQGIDVIKFIAPQLTTEPKDIFLPDGTFIGAAWPQRAVVNLMSNGNSDSTLTTTSGWKITNPSDIGATIISSTETFTTVSTLNASDAIKPGEVVLESAIIPLTGVDASYMNKVSGGLTVVTDSNMVTTATEVIYLFNLLNSSGAIIGTHTETLVRAEYNGVLGVENIDVPAAATHFQIQIVIKFNEDYSRAAFTFSNVMVQAGGLLGPYTQTQRNQCTCEYSRVLDPGLYGDGHASVMCWSIFKEYSLATHAGPIGPVFMRFGATTIGGVHRANDGTNLKFQLYINESGTVTYGPAFTVPQKYLGEYLLSTIRIRPNEEDTAKYIVEFSMIAGPETFKSQSIINANLIAGKGDIILGTDYKATDFFNGPVTEVRYDAEWVNDSELYIIALAKKPYSFKKSNDLGAADAGESVLDTLDKVGVNLILNPTGRLAFVGWSGYPATQFTVSHNDVYAGNCFMWVGNATSAYNIVSDMVPVKASTLYTLRAVMFTEQGSSGDAGVGIIWYDKDGEEISQAKINVTHIYQPKYSTVSSVAPANAVYASAFMYVTNTLRTTKMTWSRIKFEMGDATQFTDDSGAGYALYY